MNKIAVILVLADVKYSIKRFGKALQDVLRFIKIAFRFVLMAPINHHKTF